MRTLDINVEISKIDEDGIILREWTWEPMANIRRLVARRYADDPVRQGEFLKNLRATKEDMTTFGLLTLDARAWCVAFLKTEGKWKEETK